MVQGFHYAAIGVAARPYYIAIVCCRPWCAFVAVALDLASRPREGWGQEAVMIGFVPAVSTQEQSLRGECKSEDGALQL
jgi:hypothetical protein